MVGSRMFFGVTISNSLHYHSFNCTFHNTTARSSVLFEDLPEAVRPRGESDISSGLARRGAPRQNDMLVNHSQFGFRNVAYK